MSKLDRLQDDIRSYVHANWHLGLSLKSVGSHFHVDPSDADQAFRKRTGVTIKRYVNQMRERKIVELLSNSPEMYGYEMSGVLGFQNEHSFYRWVKRTFGITYSNLRDSCSKLQAVEDRIILHPILIPAIQRSEIT